MYDKNKSYVVIPEHILFESAEALFLVGEPDNSFQRMIDVSAEYREANLTPIVVYDKETNSMYCIVKELIGAKLH